jgi:hypothetical protein
MVDYPRQVGQRHGAQPFLDLIAKDELNRAGFAGGRFV